MMTKGHWIKHNKGFWRAVMPDGSRTDWICFLIRKDAVITPKDMQEAEIQYCADYECSECGSRGWGRGTNFFVENMKYCPSCGAKMEE